jgi:hypothetical protein
MSDADDTSQASSSNELPQLPGLALEDGQDAEQENDVDQAAEQGEEEGQGSVVGEEPEAADPIQQLQREALALADITAERAFAIDEETLGMTRLGEYVISILMESFVAKIYSDSDEWFR